MSKRLFLTLLIAGLLIGLILIAAMLTTQLSQFDARLYATMSAVR